MGGLRNVGTTETAFNCLSVCSGIRGIERGLERVIPNLRTIVHVEIEAFIIENLVAEMEAGMVAPAPVWSNIKTFDPTPFRGVVDIITGGYPCQPFSTAGKRRGTEDPRHLYPYIERAIRIIRPRICFFENVRGHVTCGLPEVIASLEGLGYRLHWGIYSAEETGAAHKRERVFIMAYAAGFRCGSLRPESEGFKRSAITDNAGSELGNAESDDQRNEWNESRDGKCPTRGSGSMLADDHSEGQSQQEGHSGESGQWIGNGSEAMGNANDPRLQGRISGECEELADDRGIRIIKSLGGRPSKQLDENGSKRIVSRPGQPQQAWEHPRVISRKVESAVGLSAHGYHFREDILRALGNSVYEDTAELAFRDLAQKHGLTL